ncbi:hypothetical protein PVK06_033527 [Gossypium arboreum]|uniref:RNase H type-1 domain-containing protein n=1 Tax=Gossypium arboreum TaxID=29729 RepID=A0ABR0NBL8_GOSAR|nr:hypothetical protein PVK06_033527 [Gossypium arboreum]
MFDNFLPHFCNLARRTLSVETVCPLCKKDPEDADHLVWSCDFLQSIANEIWKPPDTGVIKLNFDATFQSVDRIAITSVLARNLEGEIVGAETYLFKDVVDAFVVEARACKRALLLAGAIGFRRLIVEGDSLTFIKSIKKRQEDSP